jgi:hypothetical protein
MKKNYTMNKESYLYIIYSVAFLFAAALAEAIMSFNFDFWKDPMYWINTVIKFAMMITIYTYFRSGFIVSMQMAEGTPYKAGLKEYNENLEANKKYNLKLVIEEEIKRDLAERKINASTALLESISYDLKLEDIASLSDNKIKEYAKDHLLNRKETKRFKKVVKRLKNGKIHYETYDFRDLVCDNSIDIKNFHQGQIKNKNAEYTSAEYRNKCMKFLMTSLITASLVTKTFDSSFFMELLTNSTLIISSILSASKAAKNFIQYRLQIISNRNLILTPIVRQYVIENNPTLTK